MLQRNLTAIPVKARCRLQSSSMAASSAVFVMNILMILMSCKIVHSFLRRLGQHRMISDFIIGTLMGNIKALRYAVEDDAIIAIVHMGSYALSFYLFALGLEMEPREILSWSGHETKLAFSGIASTIGITILCFNAIKFSGQNFASINSYQKLCAIAIGLAATSSPVLTRLVTDLNIGESEIGRLAIRASIATDLICTFLMVLGIALYGSPLRNPDASNFTNCINALLNALFLAFQVCFISKIIKPFLDTINDRNPKGKPIRGIDMLVVSLVCAILCFSPSLIGFNPNFSSFVVGLCLPRDGRISNFLISRINFILTIFILPLYVVNVGFSTDYREWVSAENNIVYNILIISSIGVVGKLAGTVACSIRHGLQFPEAVALGLLLNVKGYFHVFCAHNVSEMKIIKPDMMIAMILATIATIIPTPLVVAFLVRRVRAREQESPMALQWSDACGEMRVLIGLHGARDVPVAVNVMETMRSKGDGENGGLTAYVVDMVEVTELKAEAAALPVNVEEIEAATATATEDDIVDMRDRIDSALEAYTEECGNAVRVRRLLAVSSFDDLHHHICSTAKDCRAMLIILPFHRRQLAGGEMDGGHPGHRLANQKILQHASCSVAILINRGLPPLPGHPPHICAVIIGGADDREALAYASRATQLPGVKLMVVRFLPDATASCKVASGPGRRVLTAMAARKQEMEMKADDEYFARFYERYVAGGKGVGYMEKYVGGGAEMLATLLDLKERYKLFIVGNGRERDSALTAGMNDWAECPELGPLGDILAASVFSATASVLVIRQSDAAS